MKAMVFRGYGGPDVLRLEDLEKPVPKPSEILVRVAASSVNAVDWHFLRGKPILVRLQYGFFRPKNTILGYDFAGRVETVGGSVTRFEAGAEVFGGLDFGLGAFAEYVCLPENGFVTDKPADITFEQAAAVPGGAVAALIGLRERGGVRPGQTVLVNGSSGSVGTFAVQLAKWFGAEVTAVCSTRNVEMVGRLGADDVVDYTKHDFTRLGRQWDLLLDNVGNRSPRDMVRATRPGGTVVVVGFTSMGLMLQHSILGPRAARKSGITWSPPDSRQPGPGHAKALGDLLASGAVVPEIEARYPLERLPDAIRHVETGARAKIVVTI